MTRKTVSALFWKEYRQQILLLVAIFVLGMFFQLAACLSAAFSPSMQPSFWTLGMFVTALYAAGAAGILFSREHDEKTFGFLRSLPITADTILVGKLAWLLSSTLLLAAVMGVESLLWVGLAGTGDSGESIFGVMGVAVIEALCWGVFWSVRTRSQLSALLATFFSASIGAYCVSVCWNSMISQPSQEIMTVYAAAAPWRLLLAAVIGTIAVRDARKWLYRSFDAGLVEKVGRRIAGRIAPLSRDRRDS
ncbi:MAG: ABC transporter permease, partial [Planctomycetaceae bacterium]|nr:ABC transporter permease [Planctomycetaceae bacterium]